MGHGERVMRTIDEVFAKVEGYLRAVAALPKGPETTADAWPHLTAAAYAQDASWAVYHLIVAVKSNLGAQNWLMDPEVVSTLHAEGGRLYLALFDVDRSPAQDAALARWQQAHGVRPEQVVRKDGPPPVTW